MMGEKEVDKEVKASRNDGREGNRRSCVERERNKGENNIPDYWAH